MFLPAGLFYNCITLGTYSYPYDDIGNSSFYSIAMNLSKRGRMEGASVTFVCASKEKLHLSAVQSTLAGGKEKRPRKSHVLHDITPQGPGAWHQPTTLELGHAFRRRPPSIPFHTSWGEKHAGGRSFSIL